MLQSLIMLSAADAVNFSILFQFGHSRNNI